MKKIYYGQVAATLCWFLAFALCFVVRSGYGYATGLLVLCGVACFFIERDAPPLLQSGKRWGQYLLLYFLLMVAWSIYQEQSVQEYDKLSRYLLSIPLLIALWRWRPSPKAFTYALAAGCVVAFALVAYSRFVKGTPIGVPIGYQNRINFSNISMIMAIAVAFSGLLYSAFSATWWLAYGACFLGVAAAVLGGGRGGWLMLPVILFVYPRAVQTHRLRNFCWLLTGLITLIALLYTIPQTGVEVRFQHIFIGIKKFMQGQSATSEGLRLEMWRCGPKLLAAYPWLGWGDELKYGIKAFANAGLCYKHIGNFTHLHNDFIDKFARYGLLGGGAFIALYLYPALHYLAKLRTRTLNAVERNAAWCGVAVCCAFYVGSMTNAFMSHNIGVIFFLLFNAWFMTGLVTRYPNRYTANYY